MTAYPAISDHGLIGDLQTAALVSTDGTIDWFCCPRFDSPSVFASLLDAERGGLFRIRPERDDYVSRQLYLPDTAILITRFMSPEGVGELIDFMPVAQGSATDRHRLVRIVRVVRGSMNFVAEIRPRFDYGRAPHDLEVTEGGAVFRSSEAALTLSRAAVPKESRADSVIMEKEGADLRVRGTLHEGELGGLVLDTEAARPREVPVNDMRAMLDETIYYWRRWLSRSTYTGRWREIVARSAMTLKLMTYAPTGAPIAAPTAGLPEQVGGERNWDYRYTWVRDASFSVHALLGLGYTEEAEAFVSWLGARVRERAGKESGPLKIMYRVDGTSDLGEEVLDHFEGYRESRPVRIGNGAADQLQLDIYGEAMDCVYVADTHGLETTRDGWMAMNDVLAWVCDQWDQGDEGIWETRGGRQDFTYGRVMCWVALDRAIRLALAHGWPADVERWTKERDRLYEQVMRNGWNDNRQAFVQHYDTEVLDASLLLMPLKGFVSPSDPLWASTLSEMETELVTDSLVYRYDPSASPDGLRGSEGTFSICTFWYVDALVRSGRLEDAALTFEKMMTYSNHLGLFSEEIGPSGEQLGNFPQAFSHLSLINAAISLDRRLDRESSWFEPTARVNAL
ncbi:MAG: glycoside hydrolase family 15 protein [Actinomycetota bacterium]